MLSAKEREYPAEKSAGGLKFHKGAAPLPNPVTLRSAGLSRTERLAARFSNPATPLRKSRDNSMRKWRPVRCAASRQAIEDNRSR